MNAEVYNPATKKIKNNKRSLLYHIRFSKAKVKKLENLVSER